VNRPNAEMPDASGVPRPLRIACLAKQVPVAESLALGPDGRLEREGTALEMNPYCRRAVAKGVELAKASGGSCTVYTLGPPAGEDVVREAVAWGADRGVLLSDPAFGGSDTLATARALAAALVIDGPFDLVFVGRNSIDGDTGQVGPEVAELIGLPFAAGVRHLSFAAERLRLGLEHDDGSAEVEVALPALVSVAERLCDPCKVDPEGRLAVAADRISRRTAAELGPGPWGEEASPTRVGAVRVLSHERVGRVLSGDLRAQVDEAVAFLVDRQALGAEDDRAADPFAETASPQPPSSEPPRRAIAGSGGPVVAVVAVVVEPARPRVAAELLGAAHRLAVEIGGEVVALVAGSLDDDQSQASSLGALGADEVVIFEGDPIEEDVAAAVVAWARTAPPWAVIVPSTAFGREVAGRSAAALGAGLVGDAIALDVVDERLVAAKPAFSGALVADITSASAIQMVTVRPGVLPVGAACPHPARVTRRTLVARERVRVVDRRRDDDVEVLARSEVVIGLGTGVAPDEYATLAPLAALLRAELAATRKVTDRGWAPRSRQVGITGRSIAPRLYVAVGLSGKFNHMVGVRAARSVLAINSDPDAPVFSQADVGIVGDWHSVVPLFEEALRARSRAAGEAAPVTAGIGTGRQ